MEIELARHGETEWSRDGRHTGRTDIPLTDVGRRQAEALRPALAGRDFALVLTSPLSRALETCRLAGLLDRAERTDALLEWDYGDYEGITTHDIRNERPDWVLWRDGCPNGEMAADVGARVDTVIERLREAGRRRRAVRPRPRAARAGRALGRARPGARSVAEARDRHALDPRDRARVARDHALECAAGSAGGCSSGSSCLKRSSAFSRLSPL